MVVILACAEGAEKILPLRNEVLQEVKLARAEGAEKILPLR